MGISSIEKQYTLNWLYNWLAQTINETTFSSQEKEHLKNRSKSTTLAAITSLQRSWCRPMQVLCLLFQSVSPCERCLVDSEVHVILVSSIPSRSYSLPFPFSAGFPDLQGEGPNGDFLFRLSFCIISGGGSHLLPAEAHVMMAKQGTGIAEYTPGLV